MNMTNPQEKAVDAVIDLVGPAQFEEGPFGQVFTEKGHKVFIVHTDGSLESRDLRES